MRFHILLLTLLLFCSGLFAQSSSPLASTCPNPTLVPITFSAVTGYQQIIAPQVTRFGADTNIILCRLMISVNTTGNIKIAQGKGSNCGTNTLDLTGNMANQSGIAMSSLPYITTTVVGSALCINFSATVTGGGFAVYGYQN